VLAHHRILATAALDGTCRLWDCDNWGNRPIILTATADESGERPEYLSIDFRSDGKLLALGTNEGTVEVHCMETHKRLSRSKMHWGEVEMVSFEPSGRRLLTRATDGTAKVP
jgi:WD40 repeat protein